MSTVHVLAIITTKPGQREAVLALFNANVPTVLAADYVGFREAMTKKLLKELQTRAVGAIVPDYR